MKDYEKASVTAVSCIRNFSSFLEDSETLQKELLKFKKSLVAFAANHTNDDCYHTLLGTVTALSDIIYEAVSANAISGNDFVFNMYV